MDGTRAFWPRAADQHRARRLSRGAAASARPWVAQGSRVKSGQRNQNRFTRVDPRGRGLHAEIVSTVTPKASHVWEVVEKANEYTDVKCKHFCALQG